MVAVSPTRCDLASAHLEVAAVRRHGQQIQGCIPWQEHQQRRVRQQLLCRAPRLGRALWRLCIIV